MWFLQIPDGSGFWLTLPGGFQRKHLADGWAARHGFAENGVRGRWPYRLCFLPEPQGETGRATRNGRHRA